MDIPNRDKEREMIFQKAEQERIEEAKNCKDCVGWHKYCNSECCRTIFLNISKERFDAATKYFIMKIDKISPSDQYYFKLHDVRYVRETLRFLKERITFINGKYIYNHPCEKLKENLCELHFSGKPKICQELTEESCMQKGRFLLTDNCLFKYKCKGGFNHDKEKERS